jgi:predicted enzyme related to lactoylglutathione lyase
MADNFIWYELMTSDQDAAIAFYKSVVGWTATDMAIPEMGDYRYTIISAGDRGIGGIARLSDDMCAGGMRPGWFGYIGVSDTDAAAREIVGKGGAIHMGPDDIPTVGRFAMVADPGGASFYLLTPLPREDAPPPPDPMAVGSVGWHELYTAIGQEAAFDFYSAQFGWETKELMDMGPMGKYRLFGAGGNAIGGMMDKPERVSSSMWGFYFHVANLGQAMERIAEGGGQLLQGPHQVPGDAWVLQALDPQGAMFALVSQTR